MLSTRAIEVERAWRQHSPRPGWTPLSVRRRLQQFKDELAPSATAIAEVLGDDGRCDKLFWDWACRRGARRQEALKSISRAFPGANVTLHKLGKTVKDKVLEIAYLRPSEHIIDSNHPSDRQDCILVAFVLCLGGTLWAQWSVEVSDHALH